eukprot:502701-Prymnesium_polylepis.1
MTRRRRRAHDRAWCPLSPTTPRRLRPSTDNVTSSGAREVSRAMVCKAGVVALVRWRATSHARHVAFGGRRQLCSVGAGVAAGNGPAGRPR